MKAKEYYEKYGAEIMNNLNNEKGVGNILSMINDFTVESADIADIRKTTKNECVASIIKEQNQKWNALVHIFQRKHDGASPIQIDGFKKYWLHQIPEMKNFM